MHITRLSQVQQRLWLLARNSPRQATLNQPYALRLRGRLNVEALSWAIAELGHRHAELRSRVIVEGDEPLQVVESVELELSLEDYSPLAEAERDAMVARRIEEEIASPFELDRAPLIRFFLLREALEQYVLLVVVSQLIFDRWSYDSLRRELARLYQARVHDGTPPSSTRVRYAELSRPRAAGLERAESAPAQHLDYWRQRLDGMPASLDLPTDRLPPRTPSFRAAHTRLELGVAKIQALRRLCSKEGVPVGSVALAALEVALARHSGQHDFGISVLSRSRAQRGAGRRVGMLAGLTVLRSDVPAGGSFRELVRRVHRRHEADLTQGETPLRELSPPFSAHQLTFSAEDAPSPESIEGGPSVEELEVHSGFGSSELGFALRDDGCAVQLSVDSALDLFDPISGGRLCRGWLRVLEAGSLDPDLPLEELPVLWPDDERYLIDALNDTQAPWEETLLVHEKFEAQVDARPDAEALVFEETTLTFAQLEARANRIAHALIERGVGPDTMVGLSLRRTPELVAAMLGILKAGGAYVPLDPDYPAERIEHVLGDSRARVLVTSADLAAKLDRSPVCLLVDDDTALGVYPSERPRRAQRSSQLAYVIYTSGSTGKPKGVMVEHRNVLSFFAGMRRSIGLDENGTWLAATSISFDISVLELLGSLTHGRRVVLLAEAVLGQVQDPRYTIPAQVARHGVTHFQCTPSQARILLLEEPGRAALSSLQQLAVGGEALSQELADELTALVRGQVWNLYGPTETTVWSTAALVERGARVSIGRPIANTCLFVLDAARRLAPIGAVGELYIGGPGVTRGYHDRPELDAERFVPNELRPELGARLYRTGDLVRYAPDGSLTYLGRNDHQVKVRGHRIELGEIETAIRKAHGVRDVVVVARGDASDKRLVAYLVTDDAFAGDDALRGRLRDTLPDYMLPAALVHLGSMPLTPNGKVDRNALPQPEVSTLGRQYLAPRDARERKLCEIWARALGAEQIGRSDDFFERGGHSLLAVKLSNEVERAFGVKLPLATLFECPTVEAFAARLSALATSLDGDAGWTTVVPIQPNGARPPFFCVAGVGGNPMNLRYLAAELGRDQPFYGLQMRGVDGQRAPHDSVEAMAEEFLVDLRAVQPRGPYFLGGYSFGGLAALEVAHRLRALGESVGLVVLFDTMNPSVPGWTLKERASAHLSNLRERGPSYFADRVLARLRAAVVRRSRNLRAQLARIDQFVYRNEAVWVASERAMASYQPKPYDGRVLLLQADSRLTAGDGIGLRPHETNGWGELLPQIEIVGIPSSHEDVVSEQAAPLAAEAITQTLAAARSEPLGRVA
jgi:amino acid adenylation domain-containing protein